MIYRIAIYRDGKFDRYATPEEMGSLRVSRHGDVELLTQQHFGGFWSNVSATHKVEWGVHDPLADPQKCRIYEYDIVRDCGGRVRGMTDIKDIMYGMSEATISTEAVFGNLHTYPEPLGGEAR